MAQIDEDQFKDLLRRHLKYLDDGKELGMDDDLKSLGLDSMAAVDLLFDIEDTFDVTLPDEYLVQETFANPRSLHQVLDKLAA
jgi:acyl carrier protein